MIRCLVHKDYYLGFAYYYRQCPYPLILDTDNTYLSVSKQSLTMMTSQTQNLAGALFHKLIIDQLDEINLAGFFITILKE